MINRLQISDNQPQVTNPASEQPHRADQAVPMDRNLSKEEAANAANRFLPSLDDSAKGYPLAAQSLLKVSVEAVLFAAVFIVTAAYMLSVPLEQMVGPMIAVVCMMISCMIVSGVYQPDTAQSVLTVFKRSVYGFLLSVVGLIALLNILPDVYSTGRFVFFFLFILFFVTNTVRPLLYGTEFSEPAYRRQNQ